MIAIQNILNSILSNNDQVTKLGHLIMTRTSFYDNASFSVNNNFQRRLIVVCKYLINIQQMIMYTQ